MDRDSFYIKDTPCDQATKHVRTLAIIEVIQGEVTAKQIEGEFKTLAGEGSTWRWYVKRLDEKHFQMRFPTVKSLVDVSHFIEMRLRTVPSVMIKIKKWADGIGSKGQLDLAWFRIKGIPMGKRSIPNIWRIASLVGKAKEVDQDAVMKFDFVRVKIACRDINKVPAVVEGVLGESFCDFFFQREVQKEGFTNPAGNQWIRKDEGGEAKEDKQTPKKPKLNDNVTGQSGQ